MFGILENVFKVSKNILAINPKYHFIPSVLLHLFAIFFTTIKVYQYVSVDMTLVVVMCVLSLVDVCLSISPLVDVCLSISPLVDVCLSISPLVDVCLSISPLVDVCLSISPLLGISIYISLENHWPLQEARELVVDMCAGQHFCDNYTFSWNTQEAPLKLQ